MSEKQDILYGFRNLKSGWSRVTSGTMPIGVIYAKHRLVTKEKRDSPVVTIGENKQLYDFHPNPPVLLKTGTYFRWYHLD